MRLSRRSERRTGVKDGQDISETLQQRNNHSSQDTEKANKDGKQRPPEPVGFWDESLSRVRQKAVSRWIITTAILMAFILGVLSLYWAVFFHAVSNLSSLVVYVVDFDGVAPYDATGHPSIIGPAVTSLVQETLQGPPTLGYGTLPSSNFDNDPTQVRKAVYDFEAWAAIIINPNATAMLYSAVATGNTSYDPRGAMQLVYEASRDDINYYYFILPLVNAFLTEAVSRAGQAWAQVALQNATNPTALENLRRVPQALSPAVGYSEFNLRPFYPYTAIPAVSIGLIYLIIISFFSFSFYLPIHMSFTNPEGHPPLKYWQLIIWRWCATMTAYLFLSLAYSFVSMAFQLNFTHMNPITSDTQVTDTSYGNPVAYGHGTFVVYWMLDYLGMVALGLACENVAMIIGQPWMGLWLIFWVITNVSTSFYDIDIEPRFFYWGYAWPLHQVVEASRQILFDLHSRLGLNFGVLVAWGAVNTALFPLCCYFFRWKNRKGLNFYWS